MQISFRHENSYNLKEKIGVDRLWISSNNCSHSFLIGWPICNYVAHFRYLQLTSLA